jgi:hypothetical protein
MWREKGRWIAGFLGVAPGLVLGMVEKGVSPPADKGQSEGLRGVCMKLADHVQSLRMAPVAE